MELSSITSADRVVLVLGAGASISEMLAKGSNPLPPTDANFLEIARECHPGQVRNLAKSFNVVWQGNEPYPMKIQRMEQLFASAYLRVQQTKGNSTEGIAANQLYDRLIVLLRDTLYSTTNAPHSTEHMEVVRAILRFSPSAFDVISFNYDLLADRALRELNDSGDLQWSHKDGYGFKPANQSAPSTKSNVKLLKLHGSMNWYIVLPGRKRESAYDPSAPIYVPNPGTSGTAVPWQRRQRKLGHRGKRIFPLIIPPVYEKGERIRGKFGQIWQSTLESLQQATLVIFWGYSLPITDYHAEYLFARCARKARFRTMIVNPDPAALSRVHYVSSHTWGRWFFRIGHWLPLMQSQILPTQNSESGNG